MKNIFKKILSSGLAICFLTTVCVCPSLAANEAIAEKTLKYFDETVWSDFSHAGGTTQTFKLPDGIDSMSGGNNDSLDNGTQVSGMFGKASEDLSVKLAAKARKSSNRNIYLHLSKSGDTSVNAANLVVGDKYTLYIDMAASSVGNAASHGIRIRGRQTTSATTGTEHFPVIFKTVNGNPVIQVYNDDETNANVKNIPYTLSTWVNIAVEIEVVEEGKVKFKTYVNGELQATSVKRNLAGITYVDAGLQWNSSTHSQNPDLYFDNVAFYKSGFSTDRYKAIEAASAITVENIKGSNASLDSLTGNLNLITTGSNSTTISWESSHPQLVSTGGAMTPSGTEATDVTLTATVKSGEVSEKKIYKVTVPYDENGYVNLDLNAVNADMAALNEDVIRAGNASLDAVTANLYLPLSGTNGSSITWESSAESVISTGGIVKASYIRERTVTLTATITKNDVSLSKSFTVTVPIAQPGGDEEEDSSLFKDTFKNYTYKFESDLSSPLQPFTVAHSEGVYLIYNNKLYSDRSGLGSSTASDKPYVIYKTDEVIAGFEVDTLFYNHGGNYCGDFSFQVSSDGERWIDASDYVTVSDKAAAYDEATGYAKCTYSGALEEYSNYYLKISWGSAGSVTKRFRAGIDAVTISYPNEVQLASRDFTFDRVSAEPQDNIKGNLDLKLTADYGTTVSWVSSDEAIVSSETGRIDTTAFDGYSAEVTLTATFQKEGLESVDKSFDIVVCKDVSAWSDLDFVEYDLDNLTFESFCDQPQTQLVGKVKLPSGVEGGSRFTWSVSNNQAAILNNTDYVVEFIPDDYKVIDMVLTVTATKGNAQKSKKFDVSLIRGYGKNLILASGLSASSGSSTIRKTQERALVDYWQSEETDTAKKITVRFTQNTAVSAFLLVEKGNNIQGYTVKTSTDNYIWKTVYTGGALGDKVRLPISITGEACKYVEFSFTSDSPVSLYSVELYGYLDTSAEQAAKSIAAITLPTITSANLTLPTEGTYGGTITWSSADENIITKEGIVTRLPNQDRTTTLTATLTLDGTSPVTRSFSVTVTGTISTGDDGGSGGGGGGGGGGSSSGSGVMLPYVGSEANTVVGDSSGTSTFKDVASSHWAYSYIYTLKNAGIISTADYFRPEDKITREEVLKMLLLVIGKDMAESENTFTDVDKNAWYYPYVSTAVENGIINGIGDGCFGIGQAVKRQDIAVMTHRVLMGLGINADNTAEFSYTDAAQISDYATDAVKAMAEFEIMSGHEDNSFDPMGNATRAQCAKIICVLRDLINKGAN